MKKYIRSNSKTLLMAMVFTLISTMFAIRVQFIKGELLDSGISGDFSLTLRYGLKLGVFIAMEMGCFYLYDVSRGKFVVNSMKQLRFDFFDTLISKDYPSFIKKTSGEYLAQYTNEMDIIENKYFGTIPLLFEIVGRIVLVSISMFIMDYRIAIITLLLLTMPLYVPKLVEKKLKNAQIEHVKQFEIHIKKMTDWLNGFEIIKNYSIEKAIKKDFINSNELVMEKNFNKRNIGYLTRLISGCLSYFSHFIVMIFAIYLVIKGEFSAGDFFVTIGMIDQLSYPIIYLSHFIQDLVSVVPVNESMIGFLNSEMHSSEKSKEVIDKVEKIVFEDISFGYGKNTILNSFNMEFSPKGKYLLKGKSGSGKTTSINLLLGYYELNSGKISINDVSIADIKNLNSHFTVMRQDAILFEDTLRNNLTMYQDMEDELLLETLEKVGLEKYANKNSLDMQIFEGGNNLSGGEKRRITLARSLLRESEIMIFDEPFANIDEKNASEIESLLLSIKDRMVIIISHQFSEDKLSIFDEIIEFN
ncbi:MAG: ABC transporter ATP-binding protein [Tissierellia bacterium]|nr:ABC transporter ATP-binding protein [Tissierellia bacterium]